MNLPINMLQIKTFFQIFTKMIDIQEALNYAVHIACIAQISQASSSDFTI